MKAEIKETEYIKFTENLLKNYRHIEISIWNLEKQLEEIEDDLTSLPAIVYDNVKVQTSVSGSPTENSVIEITKERNRIQKELDKNKRVKKVIDAAIENLSGIQKDVMRMYVIEGMDWRMVSDKLNYSERQLREKKKDAVKSIACALFGYGIFEEDNESLFKLV